jgi:hypothetical protein
MDCPPGKYSILNLKKSKLYPILKKKQKYTLLDIPYCGHGLPATVDPVGKYWKDLSTNNSNTHGFNKTQFTKDVFGYPHSRRPGPSHIARMFG